MKKSIALLALAGLVLPASAATYSNNFDGYADGTTEVWPISKSEAKEELRRPCADTAGFFQRDPQPVVPRCDTGDVDAHACRLATAKIDAACLCHNFVVCSKQLHASHRVARQIRHTAHIELRGHETLQEDGVNFHPEPVLQ